MNRAFNTRVLFRKLEDPKKDSGIYGITKSDLIKIEILDWGTLPDGRPFEDGVNYKKGAIGYIKKDSMGIDVGQDNKWLIDRGHILLLD